MAQEQNITEVILNLVDQYVKEEGVESAYEINNGLCDDFAEAVMAKLGEHDELYVLSVDMIFQNWDLEEAQEWWDGKLHETPFGVWSIRLLDLHGHPPMPLDEIEYCSFHAWVCYNGKHYDAEAPLGVHNWSELPLYKKMFDSLISERDKSTLHPLPIL